VALIAFVLFLLTIIHLLVTLWIDWGGLEVSRATKDLMLKILIGLTIVSAPFALIAVIDGFQRKKAEASVPTATHQNQVANSPGGDPTSQMKKPDPNPIPLQPVADREEKPGPLPRLDISTLTLDLSPHGSSELEVSVIRQGYADPIKIRVENLPSGVTCRDAVILSGKSLVRLQFHSDGTAAGGSPMVEVIARVGERDFDQKKLTLHVPKATQNPIGLQFVRLKKGTFYVGGGGGKAGEKTEIKEDFEIAVYTVTQGQWEAVMGNNPSCCSRAGAFHMRVKDISDEDLKQFPVENVSWDAAQEFIKQLNARESGRGWTYRVPTEVEWEYACREGATSEIECSYNYYFEKPTNVIAPQNANYSESGLNRPMKVGSYKPNRLGLYDMHGNVWQWCADKSGATRQPRGGGWNSRGASCQAAFRLWNEPSNRYFDLGLRLARVQAQ
jgi:formylglycine-generating enzyme required for sulfatase activity